MNLESRYNMNEFIEKMIEKIKSKSVPLGFGLIPDERVIREKDAIEIINQLAEEYNNSNDSMEIQIAKNYAKWLTKCGVNVTEKWITATEQAYALNEAYMRGMQDERDKFARWQDENKDGWIPCSIDMPEHDEEVFIKFSDGAICNGRFWISEGKTEYAVRDVFLSFSARDAILRLIGDRKSGYVFRPVKNSLADNKPIGTGTLEKWAKEIGEAGNCHCETTVHVYRKTFASETYRRTKNVKLVSKLLGHSSTAVTEKYYLIDDLQDIEYQALQVA